MGLLPPLQVDCVSFAFSRRQHIRVPCLLIQANGSAITREAVDALLDFSQRVLDLAMPYCVLWDLRGCRTPTAGLVWRFLAWGFRNKRALDANIRCVGIALSGTVMKSIVDFVLSVARPPMPTARCASAEEFWAFAALRAYQEGPGTAGVVRTGTLSQSASSDLSFEILSRSFASARSENA